jgi:hypothetical protein
MIFVSFIVIGIILKHKDNAPFFAIATPLIVFSSIPLLFLVMGKDLFSIICIDKRGVSVRYLSKVLFNLSWNDIKEVGIGVHYGPAPYRWIYFSKEILDVTLIHSMQNIKNSNDIVKLKYNNKTIAAVQQFYTGEIRNLHQFKGL